MLTSREVPTAIRAPDKQKMQLLISSRDAAALTHLKALSERLPSLQVTTRLVSNGHTDPLFGLERMPDFLLLRVSHLWREELAALLQRPAQERPPFLICGPLEEHEGIRLAMQAGARDFLPEPVAADELLAALERMIQETHAGQAVGGKLVAVMNAKGGSGATLLACNLAHQLSARGGSTLLLDLDLQFGSVAHCLDVVPAHSHVEVMQQIDEMDSVALRGFCSHFSPNLHVLGGRAGELCLAQDVRLEQLEALLRLARSTYDWVVVDLPRQIDHLTGVTLEQADRVYILLQQSLSHLKDATRLVRIMRDELGVQNNRFQVVVNRYDKASPVSLQDIAEALRCTELQKLPNDYAVVSESQNTGVPLELHAPRAPLTLGMRELSQALLGTKAAEQGLLKRTFGRLFRG
ncbi:AAA family ATPase [Pseudomonas lalucatii]|uniref:AAA family ATPase n=1 Tax=Pseudomonas lalucatii TaxID=1424203 RepID=A0ABS5PWB3_9PSED|nr:AAA family ATPase [Pseudomonas lalucatii]MBS7660791.1 AAA family ATPase [Pseudomonas lalucatii]MBS7724446.1 AAA family ATPase [Pseudomonas lalucatii]QVM87561.1 AAA family ATPase [Pseudomonas lalucatii]